MDLSSETNEWVLVKKKVLSFLDLGEDWDGQGSSPPSSKDVEVALQVLDECQKRGLPVPKACPSFNDGLWLEWELGTVYSEILVGPEGELFCSLYVRGSQTVFSGTLDEWFQEMQGVLS